MRQVIVRVPGGCGRQVLWLAERHGAVDLARWEAMGSGGECHDVVLAYLPNERVGPFTAEVEDKVDGVHLSLLDVGALALHPPAEQVSEHTRDVTPRSPLEVYLAGLQSIGSWKGFLGYAGIAGVVVWTGLVTNTVALLVGAMLIAPFASPAINTALATARGDVWLLGRSLARYGAALATTAAVAALLTLVFGPDHPTRQMVAAASVSPFAVLLPLAAGAAGALTLCQSQRGSLVSGAGAGLLVAASLAPPAAVAGMAAVMGRWPMLADALFLLGLQLAGIDLAGAAVFRLFGVSPDGLRFPHGNLRRAIAAAAVAAAALGGLLALQFASPPPDLVRAGVESRARSAAISALEHEPAFRLVEADAVFPRLGDTPDHPLLVRVYVQPRDPSVSTDSARMRAARRVRDAVARRVPRVKTLVAVTVLDGPVDD